MPLVSFNFLYTICTESLGEKLDESMLGDTKLLKATLLNMYNTILMETIQKLREQSKEDDQMKSTGKIVGSVPETSLDWEPILRERGGFWE